MTSSIFLPSSPPLFPNADDQDDDIPSSPPIFPTYEVTVPSRKRPWPVLDDPSSDPLFSDDNLGAEDRSQYEGPKQKRMLKMPWWKLGMRSRLEKEPVMGKDSGVFMGSDASMEDSSADEGVFDGSCDLPSTPRTVRPTQSAQNTPIVKDGPEQRAIRMIEDCVDNGNERIDLAGFGLAGITPAMIKPLHHLIRQAHIAGAEPPSEHEFRALTPSLKLFLAGNSITRLPGDLFELQNLTVLSLRSNIITSIPPTISRLQKLQEFNISSNALEYLPWELLRLYEKDQKIVVRPNPLVRPKLAEADTDVLRSTSRISMSSQTDPDAAMRLKILRLKSAVETLAEDTYHAIRSECRAAGVRDLQTEMQLRIALAQAMHSEHKRRIEYESASPLIFVASTTVRKLQKGFAATETEHRLARSPSSSKDEGSLMSFGDHDHDSLSSTEPVRVTGPGAPSLLEVSLQSVQKHMFPAQIASLRDDSPPQIQAALKLTLEGVEYGNRHCSTCGRSFIIPWARWIEFWLCGNPNTSWDNILPFERFACSEACARPSAPGTFRERRKRERTDGF
jgi:hypothetical protein